MTTQIPHLPQTTHDVPTAAIETASEPIRVLLADDQAMVRGGLRMILESHDDITVVAEAADGTTAVELARRLRPDVCLVDVRMPGMDGIEVTRALAGPGVADPLKVVIVTPSTSTSTCTGRCTPARSGSSSRTPGPRCSPRRCGQPEWVMH